MRWPFRSSATRADEPGDEHAPDAREDALPPENERPPSGRSRTRLMVLFTVLALAVIGIFWLRMPSAPILKPGPASDPLLTVRPMVPPGQTPAERPALPEGDLPPSREAPDAPARPSYYKPLPPPREEPERLFGSPQQLAAMGWELALAERKVRLAGLETTDKELQAKSKEADARIAEAEAWILAIKKDPRLALRARDKSPAAGAERVSGPIFEIPPPPPGFPQGSGPLVVPPKTGTAPPIQPERTPKDSEIFVRMIDKSGDVSEAMVSVGLASYMVSAGDTIGTWKVTAIGPHGIWIQAGPQERVWRPLLASGARRAEGPAPGVSAAPASVMRPAGAK